MPVIQGSIVLPANSTNENVIAGSQFEFLPYDAILRFGFTATAAGVVLDVFSGQDILAESMAPSEAARIPLNPDDFTLDDVAGGGQRIKIRARNTTAGAITLRWSIVVSPA